MKSPPLSLFSSSNKHSSLSLSLSLLPPPPPYTVCDKSPVGQPQRPQSQHHHHQHHPHQNGSRAHVNSSVNDPSTSPTHPSHSSSSSPLSTAIASGAGLWTSIKFLVVTFALLLFFNALLFFRVRELENKQVRKFMYYLIMIRQCMRG